MVESYLAADPKGVMMSDEDKKIEPPKEAFTRLLVEPPPFSLPRGSNPKPSIEVLPGIMVSKEAIDEAVRATTDPRVEEIVEQRHKRISKEREEIKNDLNASRQFLQAMVDRFRQPINPNEKYVSYDAMPAPLQRIVRAYIDAEAANRELEEAIKALAQAPITVIPTANGAENHDLAVKPFDEISSKWSTLAGLS